MARKIMLALTIFAMVYMVSCTSDNNSGGGTSPDSSDGTIQKTINASQIGKWIYFNFESAKVVDVEDANTSKDWDIAFSRTKVKLNGGHSGPAGYSVAAIENFSYDSVKTAPKGYYSYDDYIYFPMDLENPYSGSKPMEEWYNMKGMPPDITSKMHVYIIKRPNQKFVKLQMLDYYDKESGVSGFITFKYTEGLTEDSVWQHDGNIRTVTVNVDSKQKWVYFSFSKDKVVELKHSPDSSYAWDIGFKRCFLKTNSGISGSHSEPMNGETSKGYGVNNLGVFGFDDEVDISLDTANYRIDTTLEYPMTGTTYHGNPALEPWYNMTGMPPIFDTKDNLYIVQNEKGRYVKLKIDSYKNNAEGKKELVFRYQYNVSTYRE